MNNSIDINKLILFIRGEKMKSWMRLFLLLAIIDVYIISSASSLEVSVSSSNGLAKADMTTTYGATIDDIVSHNIRLYPSIGGISNHQEGTGPTSKSISSTDGLGNIAKSYFRVTGDGAHYWYDFEAAGGQTVMWLTARDANEVVTKNTATNTAGSTSTSGTSISSQAGSAGLDYHADAKADLISAQTHQRAAGGAGQSGFDGAFGATGDRIVFNECAKNAEDFAYSELYAKMAQVNYYEGTASAGGDYAEVVAYPDGLDNPIASAQNLNYYLYARDASRSAGALANMNGLTSFTSTSLGNFAKGSVDGNGPKAEVNGLIASANQLLMKSEQYDGAAKCTMRSDASGNAHFDGSMAAQGGNAQLSVNLITGDDSVTVEERRKMAGVIQDVILIPDEKSFSGTTVSRNSGKIIQDAVDRASTGDTLSVAAGLYKENLVLDKSLSIKGAGQGLTVVDGNLAGSVFKIGPSNSNIDVDLSGMTIQGGSGTQVVNALMGGGIYNRGRTDIADCIIAGNHISSAGGAYGGGIANDGISGGLTPTLTLTGCIIANNEAVGSSPSGSYGGGLWNRYGIAALSSCTVNDNLVSGTGTIRGGGISNTGDKGPLTLTNCEITGNDALGSSGSGGGIWLSGSSTLVMKGGSISSNTAINLGGGIKKDSGTGTLNFFDMSGNAVDHRTIVNGNAPDDLRS